MKQSDEQSKMTCFGICDSDPRGKIKFSKQKSVSASNFEEKNGTTVSLFEHSRERLRFKSKRSDPQMKIRMPPCIKERIDRAAERNGRSRIAEILVTLCQGIQAQLQLSKD